MGLNINTHIHTSIQTHPVSCDPLYYSTLCPSLAVSVRCLAMVPSGTSWLRCPSPPLCHGALKAIGHGYLGPCCGGMHPQQDPFPVTVSSYLSNPDQSLSAQSGLSQLSLVQPWRQEAVQCHHPGNYNETRGRKSSVLRDWSCVLCICRAICGMFSMEENGHNR